MNGGLRLSPFFCQNQTLKKFTSRTAEALSLVDGAFFCLYNVNVNPTPADDSLEGCRRGPLPLSTA